MFYLFGIDDIPIRFFIWSQERGGSPSYPASVPDDAISFEEFLHGDFRAK